MFSPLARPSLLLASPRGESNRSKSYNWLCSNARSHVTWAIPSDVRLGRVLVHVLRPWVAAALPVDPHGGVGGRQRRHVAERAPHGAVALEPRPEADLPHPVSPAHPSLRLRVRQLVPQRAAAGVAEPVQRTLAGLHVRVLQAQAALHLLQHRAPSGVHAEVLERAAEVGDVGAHALDAEHPAHHEGLEELELLAQWQHQWPQRGDVGLERVSGHGHELPCQRHADLSDLVLALVHAVEALVGGALVGAHRVEQPVLGAPGVGALVGQQRRGPAHTEDAVGEQHGAVVAEVPVEGDVLGAEDDGVRVWVRLEHVLGEVDGDQPGAAPHAAEVERLDVLTHLVVVDDHGRQRRSRVEEAAVDDQDAHVAARVDPRGREQRVQGPEHDRLGLHPRLRHVQPRRPRLDAGGKVRLVAERGAVGDLGLEIQGRLIEAPGALGHLEEPGLGDLVLVLRLVARELDEVHRAGALEVVDGEEEQRGAEPGDAGEQVDGVVDDVEADERVGRRGERRDAEHREHRRGAPAVADPELDVLELDVPGEVRELAADLDDDADGRRVAVGLVGAADCHLRGEALPLHDGGGRSLLHGRKRDRLANTTRWRGLERVGTRCRRLWRELEAGGGAGCVWLGHAGNSPEYIRRAHTTTGESGRPTCRETCGAVSSCRSSQIYRQLTPLRDSDPYAIHESEHERTGTVRSWLRSYTETAVTYSDRVQLRTTIRLRTCYCCRTAGTRHTRHGDRLGTHRSSERKRRKATCQGWARRG
ncbi:hypothetical protein HU200_044421 [Digitaria exilis]|uniref:Uncharacterized protein n=1 Tax=Digitaria exilis TaxID=1010633 RepID=A0A835B1K2_9POAL|nr:hypothetical protein HU200_044421 [Digitaria exilis]